MAREKKNHEHCNLHIENNQSQYLVNKLRKREREREGERQRSMSDVNNSQTKLICYLVGERLLNETSQKMQHIRTTVIPAGN
jgi:hypothetical protein